MNNWLGVIVFLKSWVVIYWMPSTMLRHGREKTAGSAESWPGRDPWPKRRGYDVVWSTCRVKREKRWKCSESLVIILDWDTAWRWWHLELHIQRQTKFGWWSKMVIGTLEALAWCWEAWSHDDRMMGVSTCDMHTGNSTFSNVVKTKTPDGQRWEIRLELSPRALLSHS